jgi:hypothetical protein
MTHGNEPPASRRGFVVLVACALVAIAAGANAQTWQPAGLEPSHADAATVLSRVAAATGTAAPGFATRRERWTYHNGEERYQVSVVVDGDDYRATVDVAGAGYSAGRLGGVPWRADANGVAHATLGDIQGDAMDRLPHALFTFAASDCSVAGESDDPTPSYVLVDRPPHDKPHWFWIDKRSGHIVREETREGVVLTTIDYDRFESAGEERATRWRVKSGDAANDLEVTDDAISIGSVDPTAVQPPTPAPLFVAPSDAPAAAILPATFSHDTAWVDVKVAGRKLRLVLDSGTQSIMLDSAVVARAGAKSVLDHAVVGSINVGPLEAHGVSVMSLPLRPLDGILGYDFFVGRVVHFDYRGQRVEILTRDAAERVFADPSVVVVPANYSEGLPLVEARIAQFTGQRFALDTGSPHFYLFSPFAQTVASALNGDEDTHFPWNRHAAETASYLEGSVPVVARWVDELSIGALRYTHLVAGVQDAHPMKGQIDIPFDGIVGTDEMRRLDVWFDVDGNRVGFRG